VGESTAGGPDPQLPGYGLPEPGFQRVNTEPFELRPQARAWVAIVGLWVPAAILLGTGLFVAMGGYFAAAAVFTGIGLPLAVMPPAYFFRARVRLDDRVIVKVGIYRRVGWCAPEAVAFIAPYTTRWAGSRWSEDDFGPLESHGYAFRLTDGTPIFKLSSTWWSEEGIWQLGTRLGLEGALGGTPSSGMTISEVRRRSNRAE